MSDTDPLGLIEPPAVGDRGAADAAAAADAADGPSDTPPDNGAMTAPTPGPEALD